MKQIIKKIFPNSLIRILRTVLTVISRRKKPLVTQYSGDDTSVLQCCIAYNKYGGFCIPLSSNHRPAVQAVLSGKVHEPETIDYMIRNHGKGDIVHAGTYFGDFLPALSKACVNGAKVWAFEPNPENFRCTQITISINKLENVKLTNAAVGSKQGVLNMLVSDTAGRSLGGASRLVETRRGNHQHVLVKIVTIDQMVPLGREVSILQLDVEGFEKPALIGATSLY